MTQTSRNTTIDYTKRRRVMQRSQLLGHCICDPRRGCPCTVFTAQGVCPCAGERVVSPDRARIKLTEHVHNAGCASKIPPGELEAVLGRLPAVTDPAVISGIAAGDDAGVYRLRDGTCLVQTVDVMTPCVDDAYIFGRICAANCLSDIYAMGGTPHTALSILAFPNETLDGQIMFEMLNGAMAVFAEAGVALIGGHSVKDAEIKLGFAITGTIAPAALVERGTAQVGDRLVLTKPLGVGVLSFARQIGRGNDEDGDIAEGMARLNKDAAEAMAECGVSACTDITGFGLFGHLIGMARHSGVSARIYAASLPAYPGSLDALRAGIIPGAIERNREYLGEDLLVVDGVEEACVHLGLDAQTSGGLLIAVPVARHAQLLRALAARDIAAATLGVISGRSTGNIEVVPGAWDNEHAAYPDVEDVTMPDNQPVTPSECTAPCCAAAGGTAQPASEAGAAAHCCASSAPETSGASARINAAFAEFMKVAAADGAVDARTKELIQFALVVMNRCAPCVRAHYTRAMKMGISEAELEEAAWLAVALGGAPVRMFFVEAYASCR